MNPLIQDKTFLIASVVVCFGVFATTQAVVPPPDGGYPGFNTAEGQNALKNLTTGSGNTAVGWYSLFSATTASSNRPWCRDTRFKHWRQQHGRWHSGASPEYQWR